MNDIERLLRADSIEKKKAASGVYHRAPRRGRKKGYFPHELLTGKEKRDYMKAGEVKTYKIILDKEGYEVLHGFKEVDLKSKPRPAESYVTLSADRYGYLYMGNLVRNIFKVDEKLNVYEKDSVVAIYPHKNGALKCSLRNGGCAITSKELHRYLVNKYGVNASGKSTKLKARIEDGALLISGEIQ
jgi:hypothetical protein